MCPVVFRVHNELRCAVPCPKFSTCLKKININYKFHQTFSFLIVLAVPNETYLYVCQETFLLMCTGPPFWKGNPIFNIPLIDDFFCWFAGKCNGPLYYLLNGIEFQYCIVVTQKESFDSDTAPRILGEILKVEGVGIHLNFQSSIFMVNRNCL